MSESTFPFEAAGDEPESGTDRRKLALVAGAGVLLVALLGYFVVLPMLSGGDAAPLAAVPHSAPKAKAKAKAAAAPAAPKPVAQPASYADVSARTDPFKPLIEQQVAAPVVAPPAGGTGSVPVSGGTTGTTSGSAATVAGQRVALVHVYAKDGKSYAQTKVGDTVFSPVVGETFGGSFKLLATSGKTATYLFGDEQFSLSEGQEVLK
ncbi:MAG TPA: hypothetical protein VFQ85_17780 [Mycobacteriales bacterium]|jgi:hypothetical protein|nr:hypothetical protein [Mycobacteriales bacterium]